MKKIEITDEEKWMYCKDRECYYCGKIIEDKDVPKELSNEVQTHCPFCNKSWVD